MKKPTQSKHVTVLTADPGFGSFGWGIVRYRSGFDTVMEMGVITTKPPTTKGLTKAESRFSRMREISEILFALCKRYSVDAIAFEAESIPQMTSKQNAMAIARPYGSLAMLAVVLDIAGVQTSPQRVKKTLCPDIPGPSKKDIEAAVLVEFGKQVAVRAFLSKYPEGKHNHAFDALAVYVATRSSDIMKALKRSV